RSLWHTLPRKSIEIGGRGCDLRRKGGRLAKGGDPYLVSLLTSIVSLIDRGWRRPYGGVICRGGVQRDVVCGRRFVRGARSRGRLCFAGLDGFIANARFARPWHITVAPCGSAPSPAAPRWSAGPATCFWANSRRPGATPIGFRRGIRNWPPATSICR